MVNPNETYKHGNRRVGLYEDETLSTTTHEPPVVDPIWKVTRLLETVYVRGQTQTQAFDQAALVTDSNSLAEFFIVPVFAVKVDISEISSTEQVSDYEV